jgi:hypothetical protein
MHVGGRGVVESMPGVIRQISSTVCLFLFGVCVGSVLIPDLRRPDKNPIRTDFCFLANNPQLFEFRRFVTYANMSSAAPHGFVLDSPSCPHEIVRFREELERQDHIQELHKRFLDNPYASVRVQFEGTVYRPSLLRRLLFTARAQVGLSGDDSRTITIRAVNAVGDQRLDGTP